MRHQLGADLPATGVENGPGMMSVATTGFQPPQARLALVPPGDVLVVDLRDQRVDEPLGIRWPIDAQLAVASVHP